MQAMCSVFIAVSLDGFIARPDGRIDWLNAANAAVPPGEDCGYADFIAEVDAIVMGRHTFEQVLTFDPWPFGDMPVTVLTTKPFRLGRSFPPTVEASSETPQALTARLSAKGLNRLYVDGGETIRRFIAVGLIDSMTITVVPVLLGEGRRMFGALERDLVLDHVTTKSFPCGFVQSVYRFRRDALLQTPTGANPPIDN
jgi:dihydrofolate reductase